MKNIIKLELNKDGDRWWCLNGKRHRIGGAAVEYNNGTKHWYKKRNRHRISGPAFEWNDGDKWWYIEGKEYNKEKYENKINNK